MLNLTQGKHLAQHFRNFYWSSTYQHRTTSLYHLLNFFDYGFIFLTFRFINAVVHINTSNRTVCRYHHYIQLIDIPELSCFCFCSTGHTGQFMVHTEVVLQGDRCKSLCSSFYLHAFLRFYSLMQTITPTTAIHDTSCLFVDNLYLTIHNHIVRIFFEHGVCLQQLINGVYAFCFNGVIGHQLIFLSQTFFIRQPFLIFKFRQLSCNIRKYEQGRILWVTGNQVYSFICQIYALQFFINHKIQRFYRFRHTLVILFHIDFFRLQHTSLDTRFAQELNQRFVFRQCFVATEKSKETSFLIFLLIWSNQTFGIGQILGSQFTLCFYQTFYQRTKYFK